MISFNIDTLALCLTGTMIYSVLLSGVKSFYVSAVEGPTSGHNCLKLSLYGETLEGPLDDVYVGILELRSAVILVMASNLVCRNLIACAYL